MTWHPRMRRARVLRSRQQRGLASAAVTLPPRAVLACSGSPLRPGSSSEQMHHALPALRQLRGGGVTAKRISSATSVTAERPRHCRSTARPCSRAQVLAPLQRLGQQLGWRLQRQWPQGTQQSFPWILHSLWRCRRGRLTVASAQHRLRCNCPCSGQRKAPECGAAQETARSPTCRRREDCADNPDMYTCCR